MDGLTTQGDTLIEYVDFITNVITALMVLIVILVMILAYCYRQYKKNQRQEDILKKELKYEGLNRTNALDFVKFDDVRENIVILEEGTRFMMGITCRGFDFYHAPVSDRLSAQSGYRSFLNVLKGPIAYRQYCKEVDLGYTKQRYERALEQKQDLLFHLTEDHRILKIQLEEYEGQQGEAVITSEAYIRVLAELERLQEQISCVNWRVEHLEDQLRYIGKLDGKGSAPKRPETYFFDWIYHEEDFPVEFTKEEVFERAKMELSSIGEDYIGALSNAKVRATFTTREELLDMYYRHYHPIAVNEMGVTFGEDEEEMITTTQKDALLEEGFIELSDLVEESALTVEAQEREV